MSLQRLEPGRGGQPPREVVAAGRPGVARRAVASVAEDVRMDLASAREVVVDIVASAPRDAVRVARVTGAAAVAAAPTARYVYERSVGWAERGLVEFDPMPGAGGGPSVWGRLARWRLRIERWGER